MDRKEFKSASRVIWSKKYIVNGARKWAEMAFKEGWINTKHWEDEGVDGLYSSIISYIVVEKSKDNN